MKSVFLLSLVLSPAAFAVEVGDHIQIPRAQIQCQDQVAQPRPPRRCGYCYGDPVEQSEVTINLSLDGVEKFTGTSLLSCDSLAQAQGDPALAEVVQVDNRKFGGEIYRLIQLNLTGLAVTGRNR